MNSTGAGSYMDTGETITTKASTIGGAVAIYNGDFRPYQPYIYNGSRWVPYRAYTYSHGDWVQGIWR